MSNVWGTRYRLRREQLEELATKLGDGTPIAPDILEELAVRLLTSVFLLVGQHAVNERGRCGCCAWTLRGWRFWPRRRRCAVFLAVDLALGQNLDVVWWRLRASLGNEAGLDQVRTWLSERNTP